MVNSLLWIERGEYSSFDAHSTMAVTPIQSVLKSRQDEVPGDDPRDDVEYSDRDGRSDQEALPVEVLLAGRGVRAALDAVSHAR